MGNTLAMPRKLGAAAALAVLISATACTPGQNTGGVVEPSSTFTDELRFSHGDPVISEQGTGQGTYELGAPLATGQKVAVAASCIGDGDDDDGDDDGDGDGDGDIAVSSDRDVISGSFGCSNPSGGLLTTVVDTAADNLEFTVSADDEAEFWLNVFVVDPTDPVLPEPGSEEEKELQAWSLETVEPLGTEVERLIKSVTGSSVHELDVKPGTYRWSSGCRSGADTVFTVEDLGDDDTTAAPTGLQCGRDGQGGGTTSSIRTFTEPTTLRVTVDVDQDTDITFVLARQAG